VQLFGLLMALGWFWICQYQSGGDGRQDIAYYANDAAPTGIGSSAFKYSDPNQKNCCLPSRDGEDFGSSNYWLKHGDPSVLLVQVKSANEFG
jgi:hypothetical protein